ncbi:MAG: hypothetical protein WAU07_05250 [Microgenomates group bacterium]
MAEGSFDDFKLESPVKMSGLIREDKLVFYELAKSRIKYQTREENVAWQKKYLGIQGETTATYFVGFYNSVVTDERVEKWVNKLTIVVNQGVIDELSQRSQEDFTNIIPFIVEHDVYEAWLSVKKGTGANLDAGNKHLLARRREFLLATQDGLQDRLFNFHMAVNPGSEQEYRDAMEYAQKRLRGK